MKVAELASFLAQYAKMLSGKFGVNVVVNGNKAQTDGKTVWVPVIVKSLEAALAKTLSVGYIVHECSHVLYTDFDVYRSVSDPLKSHYVNIVEDVRIESLIGSVLPGCKSSLKNLMARLKELGRLGDPSKAESLSGVMQLYTLFFLRWQVLDHDSVADYAKQAESILRQKLPGDSLDRATATMLDVRSCKSTADVVVLVEKLMDILREVQQQPPQQPQQGQGQQSQNQQQDGEQGQPGQQQESEEGDGDGQGGGSDQAEQTDDADASQGQAPGQQGERQDGEESQSGQQQGQGEPAQADADSNGESDDSQDDANSGAQSSAQAGGQGQDDGKDLASLLDPEEVNADIGNAVAEQLNSAASDDYFSGATSFPQSVKRNAVADGSACTKVKAQVTALNYRMRSLIEAETRCRRHSVDSGTKINMGRVHRVPMGDTRVFKHEKKGIEIDTAIQILIDKSGSMSGGRISCARETALALSLALEQIRGTKVAVAAFPHQVFDNRTLSYDNKAVLNLLDFGEVVKTRAGNIEAVSANGDTPLAEAMLWSGANLMLQKQSRKVLFVITDGEPDNAARVREVMKDFGDEVEIYAIGIMTECVKHLFQNHVVISSVAELPQAAFSLMQRALLKAA